MPNADSMAGSLAMTSAMVWPRARANRARQPQTSTTADRTRDPARPTAWAMSGHAASLRSTRILARRRRCVHHGTARTSVPMRMSSGSGRCAGPAAVAAASHAPAEAVTVDA